MAKVKFFVDEIEFEAEEGSYLLPSLKENGFNIPNLCNQDGIKPYGVCRICIVEHDRGDWRKVVTSCNFPIKAGMKIYTKSEKLIRERKMIAELMLSRASNVPEVVALAKSLGVEKSRFTPEQNEKCILCGKCVRACEEAVGVSAISFIKRGPSREVATPFMDASNVCIGCGSCAYVCPTGFVEVKHEGDKRIFPQWKTEFEMQKCKKCGCFVAPKKQIEYITKLVGVSAELFELCQNCR